MPASGTLEPNPGFKALAERLRSVGNADTRRVVRERLSVVERRAIELMQLEAAGTGRQQDVAAANQLRGSRSQTEAIIRGGGSKLVWAGGAAFGAKHDEPRTAPSGRKFRGYNQFDLPRGKRSWFISGGSAASREFRDRLEKDFAEILNNL
jgi:hypothetical protein